MSAAPRSASLQHPPRPRLTLRVGVTGHRFGASLQAGAIPRVEAQLRGVLERCAKVAQTVQQAHAAVFIPDAPQLIALSAMAAGADQLFAQQAEALGWRLEAVLPFNLEEYETDFEDLAARSAFRERLARTAAVFEIGDPRPGKDDSEAYEAAGLVMLDHSELLVAIWDGGESRGRGGTREIVDEALLRSTPVVWIDPTNERPPALWDGQTAVPLPDLEHDDSEGSQRLDAVISKLLAPPGTSSDSTDTEAARRLQVFLSEIEQQPPWWTSGYDAMLRITVHRPFRFPVRLPSLSSRSREWDGFLKDLPHTGPLAAQLRDVLLQRFLWADHVADRIGRAYRGAYVLNFTLAALAVSVGLLSLFLWESIIAKTIFTVVEFTLICLILAITHAGARNRWHQRFLDARRLAELLRHTRVLAPLGRETGGRAEASSLDPGERWTAWYAEAARRELSLPHGRADAAYLEAVTKVNLEHEIEPQLAYHSSNHKRLTHVHHELDHFGERLFYLTAVLCLVWVLAAIVYFTNWVGQGWIKYGIKPLLTFLGAVLPALGAALAGIRAQGDFDASAKRSLATARELENLGERLAQPPSNYREACVLQLWVADTMASDLGHWRSLYSNRPLTIPG